VVNYSASERLDFKTYREFLTRTDLGSQYPRQRFEERVTRVLKEVDICITARDGEKLVGIAFGLSDFAYFLMLTDLAVDRDYSGQGIGRRLFEMTVEAAGGERDICVLTISHDDAFGFYAKFGVKAEPNIIGRYCTEFEEFVVE